MDFRRPARNFSLSSDPRQADSKKPQVNEADAPVVAQPQQQNVSLSTQIQTPTVQQQVDNAVAQQQATPPQVQINESQPTPLANASTPQVEPVDSVDESSVNFVPAPPAPEPVQPPVIESMKIEPQSEAEQPAQPEPQPIQATPATAPASQPQAKGKHVPAKFVVAGAAILSVMLIGSVVWQQLAIRELKYERQVLGEQLKVVNPISAGVSSDEEADQNNNDAQSVNDSTNQQLNGQTLTE